MRIAVLSTGPKLYSTKKLLEAIRKRGHEALLVNHLECQVLIEEGKPTILYKNKILIQAIIKMNFGEIPVVTAILAIA